jgi:hypothetical protein
VGSSPTPVSIIFLRWSSTMLRWLSGFLLVDWLSFNCAGCSCDDVKVGMEHTIMLLYPELSQHASLSSAVLEDRRVRTCDIVAK